MTDRFLERRLHRDDGTVNEFHYESTTPATRILEKRKELIDVQVRPLFNALTGACCLTCPRRRGFFRLHALSCVMALVLTLTHPSFVLSEID